MTRIVIVHPFKPFQPDEGNCLSKEMLALKQLLRRNSFDEVQLVRTLSSAPAYIANADAVCIWGCGEGASPIWEALRAYTGQIYWFVGDPDYSVIHNSNLSPEPWLENEVIALTAIKQYDAFASAVLEGKTDCWMPGRSIYVPLWEFQFGEQVRIGGKYTTTNPSFTHLLSYIGHKRSEYRTQRLEHYFNTDLYGSCSISFETQCARHDCMPRCDANDVPTIIRNAIGTLVVGDPLYKYLNPTPQRLLQAWANGVLGFIDANLFSYDIITEHYPKLSWLYVSDAEDVSTVFELSKMDWNALLAAQYEYLYYMHKEACKFKLA